MGRDSNVAQTETVEPRSLLTVGNASSSLMSGTNTFSDAEPNGMGPLRPAYGGSELDIQGSTEQSAQSRERNGTHTDAIDGIQLQGIVINGRVDDRKPNEVFDIEDVQMMKVDDRETAGGPCNPGSAGISTTDTGTSSNARVEQQQMDVNVSLPADQHGGPVTAQSNLEETLMVAGQLPLLLNTIRKKKLKTDKDDTTQEPDEGK